MVGDNDLVVCLRISQFYMRAVLTDYGKIILLKKGNHFLWCHWHLRESSFLGVMLA